MSQLEHYTRALRNYIMLEGLIGQLAKLDDKLMSDEPRDRTITVVNTFAEQIANCPTTCLMLKAVQDLVKANSPPSVIYHFMLGIWPALYQELGDTP